MKKAGSSNSKSKIRRTSKNSAAPDKSARALEPRPESFSGFAESLSVGHVPATPLSPQDETLFRAFQSNLLSLISHELRTPLTGILNSLGVLESLESGGEAADFSVNELVRMARQNAQRLHQTLLSLLDMAAVESKSFHVRLREIELYRLVRSRIEAFQSLFKDRDLKVQEARPEARDVSSPKLGDPQKLGRAIDLCFQVLIPRAEPGSTVQLRISSSRLEIQFYLAKGQRKLWENAWSQASAGFQGGVTLPTSAFAGVLQTEENFLSRTEEGLGSELMLIHEILRLHRGRFEEVHDDETVTLSIELPELSAEDSLRTVLVSRAYEVTGELGSIALVLIGVPPDMDVEKFSRQVKKSLFRSSDAVYVLPKRKQLALVLTDCKPEDGPRLVERLRHTVGFPLHFGIAHCPADALDPERLDDLATSRLTTA